MTDTNSLPPISAPETPDAQGLLTRLKSLSWSKLRHSRIFLGSLFGVLLILALILFFSQLRSRNQPLATPLPTLKPAPSLAPTSPSPFATDSAVLDLEQKLNQLSQDQDQTDMTETNLFPPTLDLDVNFE